MREREVVATDGTVLRAWRHGRGRYPVLGVATVPELWPALLAPDAQLPLHSWRPRGGWDRAGACTLDTHVEDAIAVLDGAGVRRCVVVGWSLEVSIGVALALRHPERVAGLLLIAGVPGVLTRLPEPLRCSLAGVAAQGLRLAGPVLDALLPRLPVTPAAMWPLRHSGLMRPAADPFDTARLADRVLREHWNWFVRLALAVATGPTPDLRGLRCPVTVLVGRHDLVTDARRVSADLAGVAQARLRILPTSHFIPLEAPGVVLDEVRALQCRAAAVEVAVRAVHPDPLTNGLRAST